MKELGAVCAGLFPRVGRKVFSSQLSSPCEGLRLASEAFADLDFDGSAVFSPTLSATAGSLDGAQLQVHRLLRFILGQRGSASKLRKLSACRVKARRRITS